jgi:hypothetical protein
MPALTKERSLLAWGVDFEFDERGVERVHHCGVDM